MDNYSNLLYVKDMQVELCNLAHNLSNINKYSVETCCVIGNYYSLKNHHEKAILYFQRALRLNASYLAAWTLMGHEYLELKNTNAAIQCYRQAIDVNRLDYRAWYGLGQMYEILKMPLYCQYYYKQALQLRPNDSRMLMAMGESYEKLDKLQEAKRCYWKAHSIGDIEGKPDAPSYGHLVHSIGVLLLIVWVLTAQSIKKIIVESWCTVDHTGKESLPLPVPAVSEPISHGEPTDPALRSSP